MLFVGNCLSVIMSKSPNVFQSQDTPSTSEQSYNSCYKTAIHHVANGHVHKCPYVCCFCSKRFKSSAALRQHLNHHEYSCTQTNSIKCPMIKVVTNVDNRDVTSALSIEGLDSRDVTSAASIERSDPLSCNDCRESFTTRSKLQSHIQQSQHKASEQCKSADELKTYVQHRDGSVEKPKSSDVSCGDADQLQCSGTGVKVELNSSTNRSLRCQECGADSFKSWRGLELHQRTQHGGGRRAHTCTQCSRQFLYASDLRKHERRHTGQRPHICTVCGKGFFHRADLEVHGRIHRGEAPLTCSVCNKWMSSMTGLNAHMRIHRSGAPPNVCSVCDKSFSYVSSLRAHLKRQHAGLTSDCWQCAACHVQFSSHSLIRDHGNVCRTAASTSCTAASTSFIHLFSFLIISLLLFCLSYVTYLLY